MTPLPKKLYVCPRDPADLSKGFAASQDFKDLFDKEYQGEQLVSVYTFERTQKLELVPEHVVLKDLAPEAAG